MAAPGPIGRSQVHDFPHLGKGKAIPYGAYDIARNRAVVNVGVTHETAEFAVESTGDGGDWMESVTIKGAGRLLICADSRASNWNRQRARAKRTESEGGPRHQPA